MTLEQLVEAYGEKFVKYILVIGADVEIKDVKLTEIQSSAVEALRPHAEQVLIEQNPFLKNSHKMGILGAVNQEGKASISEVRKLCGGQMPKPGNHSDKLLQLLTEFVIDAYPATLILPDTNDPVGRTLWPHISSLAFRHEKSDELLVELLKDQSISRLFPGAPDPSELIGDKSKQTEVMANISWSNGSGGSFQLVQLPESITAATFRRAMLNGEASIEDILAKVPEILTEVRKLAEGKTINVPVVVGLSNIVINKGESVTLNNGLLRPIREEDKIWNLWKPDTAPEVKAVLVTTAELRVIHKSVWKPGEGTSPEEFAANVEKQKPILEKVHKTNEQTINKCRLALLLASEEDKLITATDITRSMLNPLAAIAPSSWRRDAMNIYPEVQIDKRLAENITKWSRLIAEKFPNNLDLGMRRLLSATTSRLDPLDGFVDAVICWENVFGTSEGEVSFRVCASIAKVLEPDNIKRRELFKILKDHYDKRSKLVHGGSEPSISDSYKMRDYCIKVAIHIIKKVISDDNLASADSASSRSKLILLGT